MWLNYESNGNNENKLRIRVISVGTISIYHAEIYAKLPQVEFVALCEYNDKRRSWG